MQERETLAFVQEKVDFLEPLPDSTRLKTKSGFTIYRGKHRSHNKGVGIKAFYRNNWMRHFKPL